MSKIYWLDWIVGAHTPFSKKISDTLYTSINYGMTATQFYMGSQQSYDRAKISDTDICECKQLLEKWPMRVFSHFCLNANFSGDTKTRAWSGNASIDERTTAALTSLEYELGVMSQINGSVVIHPGSHKNRETGIEAISESINKIKFQPNTKLLLENSAGQGTSLGITFEEIGKMIEGIEAKNKEHIGVCVDTCHLFAAGEYDISTLSAMEKALQKFDEIIGLKRLELVHLNDSQKWFGCRVDRHAPIGTGYIWDENLDSLYYLLDFCRERSIPSVLETRGIDMITLSGLERRRLEKQ